MTSWTLRARSFALTGGTIFTDWTATLVERFNTPDTFQVEGTTEHLRDLLTPGGGCTLETDDGVRFSGPLTEFTKRGDGTCTATFASDLIWVWDRICYPTPAAAWASQTTDYDTRTGAAETVLLGFVNANAGPGALVPRRRTGLTLPVTGGRGGTVTITARFDNLGQLVRDIAEAAGLRVTVVHDGATLNLTVTAPADLSGWARYGTADAGGPGVLDEDWEYTVRAPEVTRALVGAGGELAARILRERGDAAAEALWGGLRREVFVDQRNTSDAAEIDKAGDDELEQGVEPVQIRASLPDVHGMRLVTDVPVGSLVGLDLDGAFIVDRLRQVTTEIDDGGTTSGVVGSSDAGLTRDQAQFLKLRKAIRKVQAT